MAKGQANAGATTRDHGKMSSDAVASRKIQTVAPGDLIKALSWTIMTPSRLRLGMRAEEGTVAMFMYLGSKPLKDDVELKEADVFKYLYSMGFVPEDKTARTKFLKVVKNDNN